MSKLPTPPDAPLDHDFPCMRCNYNLRTRTPADLCPECATPVIASLQFHHETAHLVSYPRTMVAGFTLTAIAFFLQFAYFPAMILNIHGPIFILLPLASNLALAAGALLIIHAVGRSAASLRALRPLSLLLAAPFLAAASVEPLLQLRTSAAGGSFGPPPFSTYTLYALRDSGNLLRTFLFLALMFQLLRLARCLHAPKLRLATWLITLPLALGFFAIFSLVFLSEIIFERHLTAPAFRAALSLISLLQFPYLIAALLVPFLIFQFHRSLSKNFPSPPA